MLSVRRVIEREISRGDRHAVRRRPESGTSPMDTGSGANPSRVVRSAGSTLVGRPDTAGGPVETAIFDADSHLMETPDWLGDFADESVRSASPAGLRRGRGRGGRS